MLFPECMNKKIPSAQTNTESKRLSKGDFIMNEKKTNKQNNKANQKTNACGGKCKNREENCK
jgi:hypothetical protein